VTSIISDTDIVYTGPETIAGRYMRRFWHPVYRAQDLQAGDAKPVRIMGVDFTLYRSEAGAAHAVAFRCSHRRAQLSIGYIEGDCIRCRYHGWKFDPTGYCVERPGDVERERPATNIRGYPTEEYLGLIFVYFGEGAPPPLPRFQAMEQEGILDVTVDVLPCNYFYSLENDASHFPYTHRDLLQERNLSGIPKVWAEETDFGIAMYDQWPNNDQVGCSHKGMPNVGYIVPAAVLLAKGGKRALHVSWRVPIDDERHVTYRANLLMVTGEEAERILNARTRTFYDRSVIGKYADAVIAGTMRLSDIKDRTHIEFIQDYIVQVGQGSPSERQYEQISATDRCVMLFRRIWKRELTAFAEGRVPKEWKLTGEMEIPNQENLL
jgi:5,5'-dehydrodivanillate O-demethylase oxygenase subunit